MIKGKWLLALSLATVVAGVGVVTMTDVFTQQSVAKEDKIIKKEDKMKDFRPDWVNKKLEQSWENAIKKFNVDTTDLTKVDYFDSIHIWDKMQEPDRTNYAEALNQAVNKVRKQGDLVPVLLVNEDASETIILFQREDGKGSFVKVVMTSKQTDEGKQWTVDSVEER